MKDLIKKAKKGDVPSREKILQENIPLVKMLINRFNYPPGEKEDLLQVGCMGLLKAVDKFDLDKEVSFSTYAVPVILGEIRMYLRKDGFVKASRSLKELSRRVKERKEVFLKTWGREPSLGELAKDLHTTREDIIMAQEINQAPLSLDYNPLQRGEDYFLSWEPDNFQDTLINRMTLKEILSSLEGRERQIIILRFFEENTQQEIANKLGISQVHISRLEKKIISRLREAFG